MTESDRAEDRYVRRIYRQIILLALLAHLSYVFIFIATGIWVLAAYNVASVCFYCTMGIISEKGYYRTAVTAIHLEVCVFAIVSTVAAGWDIGIWVYLIAMTSLTYFCPFQHKGVPYVFAAFEIFVFLALKLYIGFVNPGFFEVKGRRRSGSLSTASALVLRSYYMRLFPPVFPRLSAVRSFRMKTEA